MSVTYLLHLFCYTFYIKCFIHVIFSKLFFFYYLFIYLFIISSILFHLISIWIVNCWVVAIVFKIMILWSKNKRAVLTLIKSYDSYWKKNMRGRIIYDSMIQQFDLTCLVSILIHFFIYHPKFFSFSFIFQFKT